jgi:hypothetical protein
LENNADIITKNPTEAIFKKYSVKFVKTLPKGTEMCNVTTFPRLEIIFESRQNEWIKGIYRNKMKAKGRDRLPPSIEIGRAMFDTISQKSNMLKLSNVKPLNRKERKRHRICRSKLQAIEQMTKSHYQQTNPTVLPDSHEVYGYIFKQAFNAYLTKESKETMNFSEFFTARLAIASSIRKMDMKLKPRRCMI